MKLSFADFDPYFASISTTMFVNEFLIYLRANGFSGFGLICFIKHLWFSFCI